MKNETSADLEICIPLTVAASVRFYLQPGQELTAELINARVAELDSAMQNDVIRLVGFDAGDLCANVIGVEPGAKANLYNEERDGCADLPDGVEYAPDAGALAITIEGGMVQSVSGTGSMVGRTVHIIDYDTDGADESELSEVIQADGDAAEAIVRTEIIDDLTVTLPED
ncbi:MAG: hypothetical protein E5V63_29615 [Mesorhizobium sp.]|nr:MAG: hypothetical protein E5V63_29615 [Mesorhizobium sp.]